MPTSSTLSEQLAILGIHLPAWPEEPEGGGATSDWMQRGQAYAEGMRLWQAQLRNASVSTKGVVDQLLRHRHDTGQLEGWDEFLYAMMQPDINGSSNYQRWKICTELIQTATLSPAQLLGSILEMARVDMLAGAAHGLKRLLDLRIIKRNEDLSELYSKLLAVINIDRLMKAAAAEDAAWQKAITLNAHLARLLIHTIQPPESIAPSNTDRRFDTLCDQLAEVDSILSCTNEYWVNISGISPKALNRFSRVDSKGRLALPRLEIDWTSEHGVRVSRQEVIRSGHVLDILKNNRHPNIANLLDYDDQFVYLEFIDGTVLSNKSRFCPKQWKTCYLDNPLNQICFKELRSAIIFLHSLQIAHTDITTFNIMVDKSGKPKLIDLLSAVPLTNQYREFDLWRLEKLREEIIANHGNGAVKTD